MPCELIRFDDLAVSERNGLQLLPDGSVNIYSVGISTAGDAETYMAQAHPACRIIATTVDEAGAVAARKRFSNLGLAQRIGVKVEDVAGVLPYEDGEFDFVYARLVLHYLSKQRLSTALRSLYRVMRPGGLLYTVVRSQDCDEFRDPSAMYDAATRLTSYISHTSLPGRPAELQARYFHTAETVSGHMQSAGFVIEQLRQYRERLYVDFGRTVLSATEDSLIETTARKPEDD